MKTYGPTLPISIEVQEAKHRMPGESFEEACERQARTLADDDGHYEALLDILLNRRFLMAGRIQRAIGAEDGLTAYNCFVSGTIDDSLTGIMEKVTEAALTQKASGGIGYNFSTLRPSGARISTLGSPSSGPVSFMDVFDSMCGTISSAGARRGAQMGVLNVDHPDIRNFIWAKRKQGKLRNFNISVGVSDIFMECVKQDDMWHLHWGGEVYETVRARDLWDEIMQATYQHNEPGVIFLDRINAENNLAYCEEIVATNPCGEQPLPPYGACLLGSFNKAAYIVKQPNPRATDYVWDANQFLVDIPHIVRAVDNVIDRTTYPLPEQEAEAKNKRRMGLGMCGVADAAAALGFTYGSEQCQDWFENACKMLVYGAYTASSALAREKGSFPAYRPSEYGRHGFVAQLPYSLRARIARDGIRNSHLISFAPTGTIALAADNVSSGIEPVFAKTMQRRIRQDDGSFKTEIVGEDYGHRNFPEARDYILEAKDVSLDAHLAMLGIAARWSDSAVSKTINLSGSETFEEFKEVYAKAYELGAKGCTTFNPGGSMEPIISSAETTVPVEGAACTIDEFGNRSCEG